MLPRITGIIDRRVLLNYRAPVDVVAALLPKHFKPRVVNDYALIGVCMIRFRHLRPAFLPRLCGGLSSENAAHRISVEWDAAEGRQTGVFVTRRDTNSRLVALSGGRIFPGVHSRVSFDVDEGGERVDISMHDQSGDLVTLRSRKTDAFDSAVFDSHAAASTYFSEDKIGYSPNRRGTQMEGLKLHCHQWETSSLAVEEATVRAFTALSQEVVLDHALLMHHIPHDWSSVPAEACCPALS